MNKTFFLPIALLLLFSCVSTKTKIEDYFVEEEKIENYNLYGYIKFGLTRWDYNFKYNGVLITGNIINKYSRHFIDFKIGEKILTGNIYFKNNKYNIDASYDGAIVSGDITIQNNTEIWKILFNDKTLEGSIFESFDYYKFDLFLDKVKLSGTRSKNAGQDLLSLDFDKRYIIGLIKSGFGDKRYLLNAGALSDEEILFFLLSDAIRLIRDGENRR
ncbi:MAG TPA: hypothetical protein PK385_09650 [Spirochaetota bacterium]|jgi:hypothetical protein|nr:MAG: hypothetical protein BWX91_01231 [Spirochaetes bacterium ADurb.Bin133]HNZ26859.1 hypothetical protein [Spirochaetota bacterium]HOF01946.1 hypothetical protein [Spirochaetota bacterium]HOS33801.1 hypothetical protein [Spirochaetota bacterium]HOS56309.1 hypothetical protein [Spirochaetota bacterium]